MTRLHGQQGRERRGRTSAKEKHGATEGIFSELQSEVFGYLLVPAHLKQKKEPLKPCSKLLFGVMPQLIMDTSGKEYLVCGTATPALLCEPVPERLHSSSSPDRQQLQP